MKKKEKKHSNSPKTRDPKNAGYLNSIFTKNSNFPYLLFIAILGIIIYSNTFYSPLQFDDVLQILSKKRVTNLDDFSSFSEWIKINKRPLSFFSFALNYKIGAYNVVGYHLINILVHILSGFAVFFLSKIIFSSSLSKIKTSGSNQNIIALFTALIFISHPIQTQGVTYIVQRMTSLSTMFYLFTLLFYAMGRNYQINQQKEKAIGLYLFTILSGILALLSKQIAATLPLAFLLFEFFFIRDKQGKLFKKYLFTSLITLATVSLVIILSGLLPAETDSISRVQYLSTQFRVILKYFQLLIVPVGQNLDYFFPLSESIWGWKELFSLGCILVIIGSAIYFYNKFPIYSFGIFWIFITLSVESSIIPIRDVIFEHRLYLPMFGFALIVTSVFTVYIKKYKFNTSATILVILILIYSIFSFNRNKVWASQYTLWYDVTQKSPEKSRPWYNLGKVCLDERRYNESIKFTQKSLKIDPSQPDGLYNIGLSLERLGNTELAITYYKKAFEEDSVHLRALNNLGSLYISLKNYEEAIKYLLVAHKNDRRQKSILQNLGVAYFNLKDYNNAIKYNQKFLKYEPDRLSVNADLGLSYLFLKKYDKAIEAFEKTIQLNPALVNPYIDLGSAYYYKREYETAIRYYTKALQLEPNNSRAKQHIALAKNQQKTKPSRK